MTKDKRNGNHHETKAEKSVPAGTSLIREQSKALPTEVSAEEIMSARKKAYGSADPDFLSGLAMRIAGLGRGLGQEELDYLISVIRGAEPRNQFEAMLALQMAAVHDAVMRSQHNFVHAENVAQQDSAGRMTHKLTRTYLDQLHAWGRDRSGGDQKVTVQQHVSVRDGGQAIVGNVTQTVPGNLADKPADDSSPTSTEPKTDPPAIVEGDRRGASRPRFRPKLK